ncbi:MAG: glycosyltransferase [Gemmatimonadaceae bacterium]
MIQNMSRAWGGNEKWLSLLAIGLVARGHDVMVSCPRGPVRQRLLNMGVSVTAFRPRGVIDPVSGISFGLWLRRHSPDALLITSWHSIVWSTVAARIGGVRRVVMRLGIVRSAPANGARARAIRRNVDALIVNSREIREVWLASAPVRPDSVHIVLNAVTSRIDRRAESRRALRRELAIDDDETLLVGSAGNLFERKGFDLLVRAFAMACPDNAVLVIIGTGEALDPLRNLAAELGIASRIRWLGHRTDAPELIAGLDLFVLSSRNEGMANVMLEAMAGGTPVIASDISGVQTALGATVDRPAAGVIVQSDDTAALGTAIATATLAVRSKDGDMQMRAAEAHWRIEHWFGLERMIDECESILFDD